MHFYLITERKYVLLQIADILELKSEVSSVYNEATKVIEAEKIFIFALKK